MSYWDLLNAPQREAVTTTDGPLIVLAGAGSGKTRMLTSRIAHLIEGKGVPPHQVLAVTFTNKAAGEMKERVAHSLQIQFSENPWSTGSWLGTPEIGTFHSVCMRLLRREGHCTPFSRPFVIYDDSDQLSLIKTAMEKLAIDEKQFSPKAIQGTINRLKCDALEPANFEPDRHDFFSRQAKRVYEQYQKDLFANNAIDFGEIICMTYRVLRDHPEVRAKYQSRFRYIHVDEYQDTNRAQYLLLSMLASRSHGGHENICVVGDEDQSIYKWRGADIRNILDFEQDYPGARVVKLEQNYRSSSTIIRASSQVIRNNSQRRDKTLFTENPAGEPLTRAHLPDERAEAEYVISEVKRRAVREGRTYSDFAIFYRTNAQSRQFEDVLRREKIPYQIVGGLRFYDRKEIKDVLAYFKVILNPSDSISLKRIINVPGRGIGKTTIDKLEELQLRIERQELAGFSSGDASLWQALGLAAADSQFTSSATAKKLAGFVTMVQRLVTDQPRLLLSDLYQLILNETGYVQDLRKEGSEEALSRIENLEEFHSLLLEFEEDLLSSVPEEERSARYGDLLALFIEQSALASEADQQGDGVSVKLMTLHASKGLEFPVVFLVGMEEGLFPSIKAWEAESEEDLEEERRLCYVGMTRAREILYLTHVSMRRIWGNVSYQEPARFFLEIPEELMVSARGSETTRSGIRGASSGFASTARLGGTTGAASIPGRGASSEAGRERIVYDEYSQGGVDDLVGTWIDHPEHGSGRILSVEGHGNERKVLVEFSARDRRKFLWRYVSSFLQV
ncbi:MAG: PcrA [Pseudomonadota bacterium]|jgi:DNA helicase-2/ATP-dependent DNA helicase PcrA